MDLGLRVRVRVRHTPLFGGPLFAETCRDFHRAIPQRPLVDDPISFQRLKRNLLQCLLFPMPHLMMLFESLPVGLEHPNVILDYLEAIFHRGDPRCP